MLGVATSMTIAFSALQYFHSGGGEGESTPKNGLYGEAHRSVRISLFELYEKVGKSVISVCKRLKRANRSIS